MADGSPEPNITWSVISCSHYWSGWVFKRRVKCNDETPRCSHSQPSSTFSVVQVQRWLRSADGPVEPQIPPSYPSHWEPLLPQGDAEQEGGGELENEEGNMCLCFCLCFYVIEKEDVSSVFMFLCYQEEGFESENEEDDSAKDVFMFSCQA